MGVRHRRQLWQMGDAQHLLTPADLSQFLRHLLGRPSTDAGVHFIKYQRADGLLLRQHVLQRQHDAGQLAAGGDSGNRPQILTHIGGHKEPYGIAAVRRRLFLCKFDSKTNLVHIEVPQFPLDTALQNLCRLPAHVGQLSARRQSGFFRFLQLLFQ